MNLMLLYGYRSENGRIVIDETEAAVVRRIFNAYIGGMGSVQIAKELERKQTPRRSGSEWTGNYVVEILRNEKYIGDCLMQKTFSEHHLTKKTRRNRGELDQYYAEKTHPAIIDRETYERAQQMLAEHWAYMNVRKPTNVCYPFTGKIVCGNCGANYNRRTRSMGRDSIPRYTWQCVTYSRKGKQFCSAGQIPEETLIALTCEVLGVSEVINEVMGRLEAIRVVASDRLQFVFQDGSTEERQWAWGPRRNSWTPEMRQKASVQMRLEHEKMRKCHE